MMNGAPRRPMPQTAGGMGPYAPRVQATSLQRAQRPQPAAAPQKSGDSGLLGGLMGGMGGGMMSGLSDERSKKEIARLEGANEALSAALTSSPSASYPDTKAPSSGMQALGQQDAPPSHANFADTPAANKVAAQNVGLQRIDRPMSPRDEQLMQDYQRPGFDVSRGAPDLSALDEAYARMGRGG